MVGNSATVTLASFSELKGTVSIGNGTTGREENFAASATKRKNDRKSE